MKHQKHDDVNSMLLRGRTGQQASGNGRAQAQPSNPRLARLRSVLVLSGFLAGVLPGLAQPSIISTVPPNLATGVPTTAPVVFVFSEPMDPAATSAHFMEFFPPAPLSAAPVWSSGNTVLTCTPTPAWPANTMIAWAVSGENPAGEELVGETGGVFTTGGSGSGNCTNEVGTLTLGKAALYRQTSAATPALNTNTPYIFVACAELACSNLATTNISLNVPGGLVTNLFPTLPPEYYSLSDIATNQAALDSRYPNGNYVFTLQSGTGNLACTVNFPPSLTMPNAPRLTNFAAAQAVNPSQPFVLGWDAFSGAGGSSCIQVEIYGEVFATPPLGLPGALPGSAQSVTIPANTLEPNSSYEGAIAFYNYVLSTNACGYITMVYRSAATEFSLVTAAGAPRLGIARIATNAVVISWPSPSTGWTLQQNTNSVSSLNWSNVTSGIQDDGGTKSLTVNPASGRRFYRLFKP